MKVVQINSVCGSGSTGKICVAVSELLSSQGVENYILYAQGKSQYSLGIKYMSTLEIKWQALKSRIFGNYGFQSKAATRRLIKHLEEISPDIVHLHNLHGHNVHLGDLLTYLKEKSIKIFWTFHDCWAFTGYCPYYDMVDCDRWKTGGCQNCPVSKHHSWFWDRSHDLYEKKKALFAGLDLTITTPSQWLADQVKQSFLKDYPVRVIHNGIDLSVFYPRQSDFRERYHLQDKYILLGVAFDWGPRKGLDVFVELSKRLDDRFQIVLVGTNNRIDRHLPANIISIHRTQNQAELAEIYSAADVFVNPTREDNYPTVNMEALACGTPVVTFRTGGSPECVDERCGLVVEKDDLDAFLKAIMHMHGSSRFLHQDCLRRATEFESRKRFEECLKLYAITSM